MAEHVKNLTENVREITDERYTLGAFVTKLGADNIGMLAGFVSWSLLTSLIPIVVGIVALTSLFLQNPATEQQVVNQLSNALQGVLSPQDIETMVAAATSHTGLLAIIGFVGLFWGSSNVGGSIATAFQAIFETAGRPFLKQKLIDLGMLLIMTATLLLVVAGSIASAFLNRVLGASLPGVVQFCIGTVISFTAAFSLFASIYSVFPNIEARYKQGHVWRGALFAAVLFLMASYIWPIYVRISHFSRYSAFLFSLLVLTAWIYLFAMILMLGAEIVAVAAIREAQRQGMPVGPAPTRMLPQHRVLRKGRHHPEAKTTADTVDATDGEAAITSSRRDRGRSEQPGAAWGFLALMVLAVTLAAATGLSRRSR